MERRRSRPGPHHCHTAALSSTHSLSRASRPWKASQHNHSLCHAATPFVQLVKAPGQFQPAYPHAPKGGLACLADGLLHQQPLTAMALSYMRRASAAAMHASSALCTPAHMMQAASSYVADATAYVAAERKAILSAALDWASWPIAVAARPITVRCSCPPLLTCGMPGWARRGILCICPGRPLWRPLLQIAVCNVGAYTVHYKPVFTEQPPPSWNLCNCVPQLSHMPLGKLLSCKEGQHKRDLVLILQVRQDHETWWIILAYGCGGRCCGPARQARRSRLCGWRSSCSTGRTCCSSWCVPALDLLQMKS